MYKDIGCDAKIANNITLCEYAARHIHEIKALILEGHIMLATSSALINLTDCKHTNITIAEINEEYANAIQRILPAGIKLRNSNVAELVIDEHSYNTAYFDFMATLSGSVSTNIRPNMIIKDFLVNSTESTLILAVTLSLRTRAYRRKGRGSIGVINKYNNAITRAIYDAGYIIKESELPKKYRRDTGSQTMGFLIYALRRV